MSEEDGPALFNPDSLTPADQEILGSIEKAISSIDLPLEFLPCDQCGSKIGWTLKKQSPNGKTSNKTPVFCLPYTCAYNWSQKQQQKNGVSPRRNRSEAANKIADEGTDGISAEVTENQNSSGSAIENVNSESPQGCHTKSNGTRSTSRTGDPGSPGSSKKKARRENGSVTAEANNDDEKPGPSSAIRNPSPPSVIKARAKSRRNRTAISDLGRPSEGIHELCHGHSEWLSQVMPKRIPYFPQLGDELIYFRQGHELYIRQVISFNIYSFGKNMDRTLPYVQDPNLPYNPPLRLVNLKLERMNWETGENIGSHLYVSTVPDFFVLMQIYAKSACHHWNAGDRFRCLVDNIWCLGWVLEKRPYDPDYPDSTFQSYLVRWEGEVEELQLSPWDMETIPVGSVISEEEQLCAPATEEEIQNSLYQATPEDWELRGDPRTECQRMSNLVQAVMNLPIAKPFLTPADLLYYSAHSYAITYPMGLSTIKPRLDNLFYRRSQTILMDVERISVITQKLNPPNSDIRTHPRVVTTLLQQMVRDNMVGSVQEACVRLLTQQPGGIADADENETEGLSIS